MADKNLKYNRTERVTIRLGEVELDAIQGKAEKAKLKLADYIRKSALSN